MSSSSLLSSERAGARMDRLDAVSPTILLVHGAFHGAWCWERVVAHLATRGVQVAAIELPFAARVKRDVAFLRRALQELRGDLILCSHSYGGLVSTLAASGLTCVRHLVYIAGYMVDLTTPPAWGLLQSLLPAPGTSMRDGIVDVAEVRATFYHDCSGMDAARALIRLRPMPISDTWLRMGAVAPPAYGSIPSTYVTCTDDHALSPSGQRTMARAATYRLELRSGHCPFFTCPSAVAELLLEISTHGSPSSVAFQR